MDYEGFLDLVKKRRSIRRFKPDPVPDDNIEKIIEAARWAPSGFNTQPWEFVVIKDAGIKKQITGLMEDYWDKSRRVEQVRRPGQGKQWKLDTADKVMGAMDYRPAPVFIVLFGDTRLKAGLPLLVQYNDSRSTNIYISSLAHAFVYMHLAATTLGLASQWVSVVHEPFIHLMLKSILNVPEECEVYDMMALGYPALRPRGKLMRSAAKMVHRDRCRTDEFRTDEEIRDYIRRARTWNVSTHSRGPDPEYLPPEYHKPE
jgi:nitroreductase